MALDQHTGAMPYRKRRKQEAGMDPLKGGFVRAPRRGDANEPLTPAEEAAAKIKPPKVRSAMKV